MSDPGSVCGRSATYDRDSIALRTTGVADGDHGHAALYATMSRVGYLSMILADGAARSNLQ